GVRIPAHREPCRRELGPTRKSVPGRFVRRRETAGCGGSSVLCFGFTRGSLTCRALVTRTIKEFVADDGFGLAAELAYYFFFSLFPAVLVGLAVASFFPLENLLGRTVSMVAGTLPGDVITIIQDQIWKISESNHGGILTFGLFVAIWSSSA